MKRSLKFLLFTAGLIFCLGCLICHLPGTSAQTKPLTYPEIITALNTKLPNSVFKNKAQLISFLVNQIKERKVDKPLTKDYEDLLREAGATAELLRTIRENSPARPDPTPSPTPARNASYFIKNGNEHRAKGAYELALGEYKKAFEIDPENADVFLHRAMTFHSKNAAKLANADYEKAIELKPELNQRADVQCLLLWFNDKKADDCSRAIALYPDLSLAYLNRAIAHSYQGKANEALRDFDKALKLDPKLYAVYIARGDFYIFKDRLRAFADFDKAVELYPGYPDGYYFRGLIYSLNKDDERALADYTKAISADRGYVIAYKSRGDIYLHRKNDYDRALADFDALVRLQPENAESYRLRGNAYFAKKDFARAALDFDQAVALKTSEAEVFFKRGEIYRISGEHQVALAYYNMAIERDSRYADAYAYRGYLYESRFNEAEKAAADYRKTLELDPGHQFAREHFDKLLKKMR